MHFFSLLLVIPMISAKERVMKYLMIFTTLILTFLNSSGFPGSKPETEINFLAAEDFYSLRQIIDCRFSPDGKQIVYVLQRSDKTQNKYIANLWIVNVDNNRHFQLTNSDAFDHSPCWSPDGKYILFVSNRSGKNQLWMISMDGGEAWSITNFEGGATSPAWSPDGANITFLSHVPETKHQKDTITHNKINREFASDVKKIVQLKYRTDTSFSDSSYSHIFIYNLSNQLSKQLTYDNFDDLSPCWSHDSKYIAFTSHRNGDPTFDNNSDIYTTAFTGGEINRISRNPGPDWNPVWDAKNNTIYYLSKAGINDFAAQTNICQTDYNSLETRILTDIFDRNISQFCTDYKSKYIYFNAIDRGNISQFRLRVKDKKLDNQIISNQQIEAFDVNSKNHICYIASNPLLPSDLFYFSKKSEQLTHINDTFIKSFKLSVPEEFYFKGYQDEDIQGWLMKPVNYSSTNSYPLVVEIHGGPHWAFGNDWNFEFQLLAAQGYLVFYCNPRLSTGYGEKFTRSGVGEWGIGDFHDIMKGVDYVIREFNVDTTRMGVIGGSYGGFMTNWIISHSNRFRTAITQRGISNLLSFYGTTDIQNFVEFEFDKPWNNMDKFNTSSPITYAPAIKTPLLIIHSELDYRVPIGQAEELFTAMKRLDNDVEFIRYSQEGHELSRSGQPVHRVDRYNRILSWFEKYFEKY